MKMFEHHKHSRIHQQFCVIWCVCGFKQSLVTNAYDQAANAMQRQVPHCCH